MTKSYIYLTSITIVFTVLTTTRGAQALTSPPKVVLNSTNIFEIYKTHSTRPAEIENSLNINQSAFEQLDLKYKLTTTLDASKQNDQTDSLSTGLQQDNDTTKYTWLTSKRYLSGTTLGLEVTHLDNALGTLQTQTLRTETNQNYFAINFDQPIFPNFFGSQERALYTSTANDFELKKIQTVFDQMTAQKELLQTFWKTKALAKSVEENTKLINEYEKLAKKVLQKKSNQFAAAGELEQALSEFETRKQSLKSDQAALSQAMADLKTLLNIPVNTEIQFDQTSVAIQKIPAPQFAKINITRLKKYRLQELKLRSTEDQLKSVSQSTLPQFSVYAKYTQSGFDASNSVAVDEATDDKYKKYLIGIKLDYTFDNSKAETDQKIKKLSYDIEKNKSDRSNTSLPEQIELAKNQLFISFEDMTINQKILEYRKKAVTDISKNYFQGRTDISSLIDAYNKKNIAEINLINSYGNYEVNKMNYDITVLE